MARKIVNRKELRSEIEAAEAEQKTQPTKKKKAAPKKTKTRRSRAKELVDVQMKLFWGVFNQSLKRVALYEFSQRKQADKKAADLSKSGKSPHFVQRVKQAIQE